LKKKGVLREILKHSTVEEVVICELDEMVIEVSKKYLPKMASSFADKRVNLHLGDGAGMYMCFFLSLSLSVFSLTILAPSFWQHFWCLINNISM
jgi:hypothetical protein